VKLSAKGPKGAGSWAGKMEHYGHGGQA